MTDHSVSALIPVRDGERFLAAAIESALSQTLPCSEVVVVDNGSTDRSRQISEGYRDEGVRTLTEPAPGTAAARNAALQAARGTHLAFLDADDLWEPHKNEVQLEALAAHEEACVVMGHVVQFRHAAEPGEPMTPQPGPFVQACLASRGAWDRIGPWPEGVPNVGESLDWLLRLRRAGLGELMLEEVVLRRRVHGQNTGVRERHTRVNYARIMKREIDRRRAAGS